MQSTWHITDTYKMLFFNPPWGCPQLCLMGSSFILIVSSQDYNLSFGSSVISCMYYFSSFHTNHNLHLNTTTCHCFFLASIHLGQGEVFNIHFFKLAEYCLYMFYCVTLKIVL